MEFPVGSHLKPIFIAMMCLIKYNYNLYIMLLLEMYKYSNGEVDGYPFGRWECQYQTIIIVETILQHMATFTP